MFVFQDARNRWSETPALKDSSRESFPQDFFLVCFDKDLWTVTEKCEERTWNLLCGSSPFFLGFVGNSQKAPSIKGVFYVGLLEDFSWEKSTESFNENCFREDWGSPIWFFPTDFHPSLSGFLDHNILCPIPKKYPLIYNHKEKRFLRTFAVESLCSIDPLLLDDDECFFYSTKTGHFHTKNKEAVLYLGESLFSPSQDLLHFELPSKQESLETRNLTKKNLSHKIEKRFTLDYNAKGYNPCLLVSEKLDNGELSHLSENLFLRVVDNPFEINRDGILFRDFTEFFEVGFLVRIENQFFLIQEVSQNENGVFLFLGKGSIQGFENPEVFISSRPAYPTMATIFLAPKNVKPIRLFVWDGNTERDILSYRYYAQEGNLQIEEPLKTHEELYFFYEILSCLETQESVSIPYKTFFVSKNPNANGFLDSRNDKKRKDFLHNSLWETFAKKQILVEQLELLMQELFGWDLEEQITLERLSQKILEGKKLLGVDSFFNPQWQEVFKEGWEVHLFESVEKEIVFTDNKGNFYLEPHKNVISINPCIPWAKVFSLSEEKATLCLSDWTDSPWRFLSDGNPQYMRIPWPVEKKTNVLPISQVSFLDDEKATLKSWKPSLANSFCEVTYKVSFRSTPKEPKKKFPQNKRCLFSNFLLFGFLDPTLRETLESKISIFFNAPCTLEPDPQKLINLYSVLCREIEKHQKERDVLLFDVVTKKRISKYGKTQ